MPNPKGKPKPSREDRVMRQAKERLQGAIEDPDCVPFLCVEDVMDFVIGGLDDTVTESESEHIRIMVQDAIGML